MATKLALSTDLFDYAPYSTAFTAADGFDFGDLISFSVQIVDPGTDRFLALTDYVVDPNSAGAPGAPSWTEVPNYKRYRTRRKSRFSVCG
jgi:hypothetical protein